MGIVTEIVKMKSNGTTSNETFMEVVNGLETDFHSKQSGFIDTELLHDEKMDTWYLIQHWNSMEDMKAASSRMFRESVTEPFRNAIDPKAITIDVLPQLMVWGNDN